MISVRWRKLAKNNRWSFQLIRSHCQNKELLGKDEKITHVVSSLLGVAALNFRSEIKIKSKIRNALRLVIKVDSLNRRVIRFMNAQVRYVYTIHLLEYQKEKNYAPKPWYATIICVLGLILHFCTFSRAPVSQHTPTGYETSWNVTSEFLLSYSVMAFSVWRITGTGCYRWGKNPAPRWIFLKYPILPPKSNV